jgi:hypothetical protein
VGRGERRVGLRFARRGDHRERLAIREVANLDRLRSIAVLAVDEEAPFV